MLESCIELNNELMMFVRDVLEISNRDMGLCTNVHSSPDKKTERYRKLKLQAKEVLDMSAQAKRGLPALVAYPKNFPSVTSFWIHDRMETLPKPISMQLPTVPHNSSSSDSF